jgi:hypothetical protein
MWAGVRDLSAGRVRVGKVARLLLLVASLRFDLDELSHMPHRTNFHTNEQQTTQLLYQFTVP